MVPRHDRRRGCAPADGQNHVRVLGARDVLTQARASRDESLLEALNFCCGTIGLELDTGVLSFPARRWLERADEHTKKMTVKASPLLAQALCGLEVQVTIGPDLTSRHLAGFFADHDARPQCRDTSRLAEEPLLETAPDGAGFLEMKAGATLGRDAQPQT